MYRVASLLKKREKDFCNSRNVQIQLSRWNKTIFFLFELKKERKRKKIEILRDSSRTEFYIFMFDLLKFKWAYLCKLNIRALLLGVNNFSVKIATLHFIIFSALTFTSNRKEFIIYMLKISTISPGFVCKIVINKDRLIYWGQNS